MEIIIGEDIKLKLFTEGMASAFFESIHKEDLSKDYFLASFQEKYSDFNKVNARMIDAIKNKYQIDGTPDFFIFYKEEIAGVFEFHPLSESDFIEVGFWLFPRYRNKKLLSKTFPAVINYTQRNFIKKYILAETLTSNKPSQSLLEKVGFVKSDKVLEVVEGDKTEYYFSYRFTLNH